MCKFFEKINLELTIELTNKNVEINIINLLLRFQKLCQTLLFQTTTINANRR